MATDKISAKTPAKKTPAAAKAAVHALPVDLSVEDDTPAASKAIQKLQRAIVDGLEDVKAQNIQVFNTTHMSPLFERVVIASGTSNRQTKALAASVRDAVRDAGFNKPRMEGEENGEWIIVDCGSAVVHIMQPAIRQYYTLEDIWGEKPVRLRMGAPAARAATEKKVSRTAARTAAKKEAAAAAAEVESAPVMPKPVRKTAAAKPAADESATQPAARTRAKPAATKDAAAKPAAKASAPKPAARSTIAKPAAARPAAAKAASKPAAARKPAAGSATTEVTASARKPAARTTTAKPAADTAAKSRAGKAAAVTLVVGKTVTKKAVKSARK